MRKVTASLLVAMQTVLCCTAAFAEETPRQGGELVVAMSFEPDTMNVYATHLMGDVQAMVVEGLLVPNGDMEYEAVLATEVPTVENGGIVMNDDGTMDITYHLVDDVYWHCGEKFTSHDVLVTWETLHNEEWECESKDGVYDIDSIECPDDLTVVCHYNTINPDFASTLFTFGIMPAHEIEGADMNDPNLKYNVAPCGTGPYVFSEWNAGENIKLTRNENYWREGAYMDGVTILFVPDENTRITMLKSGEIDFTAGVSYVNYEQVKDLPGYEAIVHGMNSWRYLTMNWKTPGLDDVNVRRAISCALDKDTLVNQLFSGIPQAWSQPWMPSDPYHVEDFTSEWSYDVDKANALLDEAGYTMGDDGVRVGADGTRLEFELITRTGQTDVILAAQVVASSLGEIGIKVNTREFASSEWSSMTYGGEYQMSMGGFITSPGASRTVMYSNDGVLNTGSWKNDEFTALCEKIDCELDFETRKDLVKQALTIFDSELPQIVIYANTEIVVATDKLQGFVPNATNMSNFCQMYTWWLAE